jgi:hypothetical protein
MHWSSHGQRLSFGSCSFGFGNADLITKIINFNELICNPAEIIRRPHRVELQGTQQGDACTETLHLRNGIGVIAMRANQNDMIHLSCSEQHVDTQIDYGAPLDETHALLFVKAAHSFSLYAIAIVIQPGNGGAKLGHGSGGIIPLRAE